MAPQSDEQLRIREHVSPPAVPAGLGSQLGDKGGIERMVEL